MSGAQNIYRWDRITKPRTYSRSQRLTTTDDVQDWIKKVEEASNNAAAATFGAKYGSRGQGHRDTQMTLDLVHQHDAAYSEAQDLLKEWVSEKLNFDQDEEFVDDSWHKTASDVKKEWDKLVDVEDYGIDDDGTMRILKHKVAAADVYTAAEDVNDRDVVDGILQNMLDKDLVSDVVINDLGLNDQKNNGVDPSTKMKLRHQQVKENREKRNKMKEQKMVEQQRKKEAQHQAKQILLKEEREKALRKRQEESEIQKEMARIRKELQEEKKKEEEEKRRLKKLQEEENTMAAEEFSCQQREFQLVRERQQKEAERQRHLEAVTQKIRNREIRNNYKILHKCFCAWYDLIIQRRLQMGKACAMSDWKRLLRSWTAWKAYTRNRKVEKEALEHEYHMKLYHRNALLADDHYRLTLLRKALVSWQMFVQQELNSKKYEHTQEATRSKMAAFLEAAATGMLWDKAHEDGDGTNRSRVSKKSTEYDKTNQRSARSRNGESATDSARCIVDDMFASNTVSQPNRRSQSLTNLQLTERTDRSDQTGWTVTDLSARSESDPPLQPWQITRKHLKLTKEQIAALAQKGAAPASASSSSTSQSTSPGKRARPWEKTAPVVNNFEYRHTAQQKMLNTQQKQIREQQRLIEDLQYMQRQQLMQQTIMQQQALQQQLDKVAVETLHNGQMAISQQNLLNNKTITEKSGPKLSEDQTPRSVDGNTARSATTSDLSTTTARRQQKENSKDIKFVKAMEDRAAERARLKREREERKQKQDQERLAQIQAEEEARRAQEEEEKRRQLEAYREKKRLQKQQEIEKQHWEQHLKELTSKAHSHYQLMLLRQRGWKPWRRLVEIVHEKEDSAKAHYQRTVMRKCLLSWHVHARGVMQEKEKVADKMREYLLIQHSFNSWKKFGLYMVIQEEKANRHYHRTTLLKVIRAWADYTTTEQIAGWEKERRAREHDTWRMTRNAFQTWRKFPLQVKMEAEREKRKEEMRKKVASMLPDFQTFSHSDQ